jgi:spoIIIJ-associated protein
MNTDNEAAILYAKKYIEDLLSFFGLNTDVYATSSDDEVIELHVPSTQLNSFLIGQHGDTMHALQFLVSNALRSQNYELSRVNLDIADYKKQRADRLAERAEGWLKQVKDTKQPFDLRPMNAADRRIIHQLAAEWGLSSESSGEGRDRHIILGYLEEETDKQVKDTEKPDKKTKKVEEAETTKEVKQDEETKETEDEAEEE